MGVVIMKTRTCKRCNGSGFRSTPVVHLGVPGLCYGCNGSGVQTWVEAAVITAERQRSVDRHIAEVKQIIADCKAAIALNPQRRNRGFIAEMTLWTEHLATMATTAKPATKGEWRAAARQTEKAGV